MKQKEIIFTYVFSITTTLLLVQQISIGEIFKNYPVGYLSILLINIFTEFVTSTIQAYALEDFYGKWVISQNLSCS